MLKLQGLFLAVTPYWLNDGFRSYFFLEIFPETIGKYNQKFEFELWKQNNDTRHVHFWNLFLNKIKLVRVSIRNFKNICSDGIQFPNAFGDLEALYRIHKLKKFI